MPSNNKKVYKKRKRKRNNRSRIIVRAVVFAVCAFALIYKNYLSSDYNTDKPVHNDTDIIVENTDSIIMETTAKINDPSALLNGQQAELLQKYALRYANTLTSMSAQDISGLYADTSSKGYAINKTAFDVLTSIRGMRDIDLTLEYASVEYDITDIDINGNNATVYLLESNTQKFRHLSHPSYAANLYHEFVLTEKDGQWFIKSHMHEEDFYLLTEEAWPNSKGADNTERGKDTLRILMADARENLADLGQFQQGRYYTDLKVADTSYDRDAAVEYASKWWNTRNYTGHYLAYDAFGGNCQNFASQSIHAGGIKMDHTGILDLQWKFYDEDLNTKQTAKGRSYSWTGVDMFYTYALHNYEDGLVALTDIDYKYAEKGDIIHVGAYHHWRHALLITDVLKNADGTQQDIIVASNTADRWNYPLSAYIYTAPRLIHILGQN